jgi:hydroxymethylpyrimidine pyrophosphatase-like HAD family hydrolase
LGDDYNDIEILQGFMHSYAMANAVNEATKAANHVTLSNDDDGVYHALSKLFNIYI